MAFESLGEKFKSIFSKIRGNTRLTETNMQEALKEIRLSLLDADVNYKVVKEFLREVEEKAVGEDIYKKVNPSQMLTKIIHDEIQMILGGDDTNFNLKSNLNVIMMCGLQGSGKTTSVAKLVSYLKKNGKKKVLVAACDTYRPGAVDQLKTLVEKTDGDLFFLPHKKPVEIAKAALDRARLDNYAALIIDTAGRLAIDEVLMEELVQINEICKPNEILFTIDSMSGQEGVNVAIAFKEKLPITGAFITKFDSEARSGVALSIRYLSHIPVKFLGTGEKPEDYEVFHPERVADRILGMGDVITLVEKAKEAIDEKEAAKAASKFRSGNFTLDDLIAQTKQIQKLGSLKGIMKMIPGMPSISDADLEKAQKKLRTMEVLVNSMTFEERANPEILKHQRKQRIVGGSGRTIQELNRMLQDFDQMKDQMKKMKNNSRGGGMGGMPGMPF